MSGEKWERYPKTIGQEYYAAIGEICARWAWLEFQLGVIARETLKIKKDPGFAVMGGMSMKSVSTVLVALNLAGLPKGKPKTSQAIRNIGTKLSNLGDMRNEYAHALWCYEKESNRTLGIRKLKSAKDRTTFRWTPKTINELRAEAKLLSDLQVTAQEITDALKGRPSRFS